MTKMKYCKYTITPLISPPAWAAIEGVRFIPSELGLSLLPSHPFFFPASILLKEHPDILFGQLIFPALFPGDLQL